MNGIKNNNPIMIGVVSVLVLALASYGVFKYVKRDTASQTQIETPVVPPVTKPVNVPVIISSSYKDGAYSAVGSYFSPGGDEQIWLQVTLKDDLIIDTQVESKATRPNSIRFQGIFISNFKPLVVGKKIDEVQLSKVSGSSLTSGGFNDALAKIKAEAKV